VDLAPEARPPRPLAWEDRGVPPGRAEEDCPAPDRGPPPEVLCRWGRDWEPEEERPDEEPAPRRAEPRRPALSPWLRPRPLAMVTTLPAPRPQARERPAPAMREADETFVVVRTNPKRIPGRLPGRSAQRWPAREAGRGRRRRAWLRITCTPSPVRKLQNVGQNLALNGSQPDRLNRALNRKHLIVLGGVGTTQSRPSTIAALVVNRGPNLAGHNHTHLAASRLG